MRGGATIGGMAIGETWVVLKDRFGRVGSDRLSRKVALSLLDGRERRLLEESDRVEARFHRFGVELRFTRFDPRASNKYRVRKKTIRTRPVRIP